MGDARAARKSYGSDEIALICDCFLRHKWAAPQIARYHADNNWPARTAGQS